MAIGLLGKKLGMTRVYDEKGRIIPVTVVEAAGNRVLQVKDLDKEGYRAVQVGVGDQKPHRVAKPQLKHFEKTESTPKRFVREFRLAEGESAPESADLPITLFEVGQFVDVVGTSKGKGFSGVMKRHGYAGQPAAHGSMMHRRTGAIGNRSTPGRVWKNKGMPGNMGNERVTVQNLQVVQVREAEGLLLIKGAIAGAKGSFLVIRPAKKKSNQKGQKS